MRSKLGNRAARKSRGVRTATAWKASTWTCQRRSSAGRIGTSGWKSNQVGATQKYVPCGGAQKCSNWLAYTAAESGQPCKKNIGGWAGLPSWRVGSARLWLATTCARSAGQSPSPSYTWQNCSASSESCTGASGAGGATPAHQSEMASFEQLAWRSACWCSPAQRAQPNTSSRTWIAHRAISLLSLPTPNPDL